MTTRLIMLIIARIIIPNRRLSKEVILIELSRSISMDILCPLIFWRVTICLLLSIMILLVQLYVIITTMSRMTYKIFCIIIHFYLYHFKFIVLIIPPSKTNLTFDSISLTSKTACLIFIITPG